MKKNMGATDKTIRVLIAIVIAILYFTDVISGTLAIILGIIALVFVVTSLFSFCPGYVPLKMSTAKKETK
jgi:Inner membrane protein YgaP-like, transmembrane domain